MKNNSYLTFLIFIIITLITGTMSLVGCNGGDSEPTQQPGTTGAAGLPDLLIAHEQRTPGLPKYGEPITFTVDVKNAGNAPADTTVLLIEFWSPGDSHEFVERVVNPIPPGQVVTLQIEGVTPSFAGPNTFRIIADGEETLDESNEGNNVKEFTIDIQ